MSLGLAFSGGRRVWEPSSPSRADDPHERRKALLEEGFEYDAGKYLELRERSAAEVLEGI